jgi:dTDP-4-amino-4,6-dideoxygalactose transaminase
VNAHEQPAYAGTERARVAGRGLPVSERLSRATVLLPLFHGMTDVEVDQVVQALRAL